ncbi:MAG TPA: serine/threonine-protein kinase [Polyangiaceae bacterium]|jgi:serine/threonine protein kinase
MGIAERERDDGCIPEATLAAFAEGQVDSGDHSSLEDHLAKCVDCRAILARAAGVSRPLDAVTSLTGPSMELDETLPTGTRVGRYVIEGLIGRGAMGAVYSASDPDLARKVAVKLLRAEGLSDEARRRMRARLLREAQSMARLSHPEVITVHDVGAFGDQLFVAMEYIAGGTLRQWQARERREVDEILAAYERAGNGLAAAHDAGLVHRDFKPDNVLVGEGGRVRVTDFGLARSVDGGAPGVPPLKPDPDRERDSDDLTMTLTRTGVLLGTPAYMAPEQLEGSTADARSDVFSFCTALYEALYGERPFAASTVDGLREAIARGNVRLPRAASRVPSWVRAPLLRGLRWSPDERPASMRALLDDLRAARSRARMRTRGGAAFAGLVTLALVAAFAGRGFSNGSWSRETVNGVATPGRSEPASAIEPVALKLDASGSRPSPLAPATQPVETSGPPGPPVTTSPRPSRHHIAITPSVHSAPARPSLDAGVPPIGNNGAYILE